MNYAVGSISRKDFDTFFVEYEFSEDTGQNIDSNEYSAGIADADLPQIPFGPEGPQYAVEARQVEVYAPNQIASTDDEEDYVRIIVIGTGTAQEISDYLVETLFNGQEAETAPTSGQGYPAFFRNFAELQKNPNIVLAEFIQVPSGAQIRNLSFSIDLPYGSGEVSEGNGFITKSTETYTVTGGTAEIVGMVDRNTPFKVDLRDTDGVGYVTLAGQLGCVSIVFNTRSTTATGMTLLQNVSILVECEYKKMSRDEFEALAIRQAQFSY